MPGVDKRQELINAIQASINANSLACASCLEISMSAEDGAKEAFKVLAELCATNVKTLNLAGNELRESWGIIDFRRDIESL